MSEGEPRKRKVVETRHFTTSGRKEDSEAARNQRDREFLRDVAVPGDDDEYFNAPFVNLRLPPTADLPSVEIFNPMGLRMAAVFKQLGYVRLPEREKVRWLPSAGMAGRISEMDQGTWVERNDDGSWPSLDPLDHIVPEDIKTEPTPEEDFPDGIDADHRYKAVYTPTGHFAYGRKPLNAHKNLLEKLERIEERGESHSDE
ncbi:hypothetical protein SEA_BRUTONGASTER_110 [Gordonia phage BrutonGaster]|uniref:Uncharacterized protein n=1 Tax=Gordonia phage BrutonGaster TaxID=2530116 RepID=A0A482JHB7_9CAUD|nr:hypothetical protein HOV26_gp072 [Gordonia phage BrutonGaster]QBP33325.1 hypothetical protein SEA_BRUTONGASTER_110 [Gordonia phage BrutonGaster]